MKIYRFGTRQKDDEHDGYYYSGNKKDAKSQMAASRRLGFEVDKLEWFEIPNNKKGLIEWLNIWAAYPNNG